MFYTVILQCKKTAKGKTKKCHKNGTFLNLLIKQDELLIQSLHAYRQDCIFYLFSFGRT